jgi:serine/threonine-protein kinase
MEDLVERGYRLVKPLGAGGMGAVYVGEKITTHQLYAVKFLKEDLVRDPTYLARFEREINALVAIRHPHVVNVFDWWFPPEERGGKPFVVMELLDGEGLDQRLKGNRLLPPLLAVKIMVQTLEGLGAAHRLGVIHRDLGPSNIFLCATNTEVPLVKILDFGLARPIVAGDEADSNLTTAGTLVGKPGYVPPEVFLDLPLDERSDIFACGMMLYRMLAGRLPFRATQARTLWVERFAESQAGNEVPGIRNHASWVPESLERIVTLALRHRADERYANIVEMQTDLLAIEAQVAELGGSALGGALRKSEPPARSAATTQPPTTGRRASVTALPRVPQHIAPKRSRAVYLLAALLVACLAGAAALLYSEGVFDSLFGGSSGGTADAAAVSPATIGTPAPSAAVRAAPPVPDAADAALQAPDAVDDVVPSADRVVDATLERSAPRPGGGRPGNDRPSDGGSAGPRRDAGTSRPAFVDNPFR